MKHERFISVAQYAYLAGVGLHAIYMRRDRDQIKFTSKWHKGKRIYLIDTNEFPVIGRQKRGVKAYPN